MKEVLKCLVLWLIGAALSDYCSVPCSQDGDCAYGACCNGMCIDPLPLGSPCGGSNCGSCGGEGSCINGICTMTYEGCSCATDSGCGPYMICIAGACADSELELGDSCLDSRQCGRSTACLGSICMGNATLNQSCSIDPPKGLSYCQDGYWCNGGTCQNLIADGQQCNALVSNENGGCLKTSFCLPQSNNIETCTPRLAIGRSCSNQTVKGCVVGSTCWLQNNTCIANGVLGRGSSCSSDVQCQSGFCGLGPLNGTSPSSYCIETQSLPDGAFCNPTADECIGVCRCTNGLKNCPTATCIPINSLPDGSKCHNSLECQNSCSEDDQGYCYTFNSLPDGSNCTLGQSEACLLGSTCKNDVCTPMSGTPCIRDSSCGLGQKCVCNGENGACQSDPELSSAISKGTVPLLKLMMQWVKNFPQGCGDDFSDPECQAAYVEAVCAMACRYSDVDIPFFAGTPPFITVDCTANTVRPGNSISCCKATNDSCLAELALNQVQNCPIQPISSISSTKSHTDSSIGPIESESDRLQWGAMILAFVLTVFMQ